MKGSSMKQLQNDETELIFEVLRQVHAAKAASLADMTLLLPDNAGKVHLIEDEGLRRHLGLIIQILQQAIIGTFTHSSKNYHLK